MISNQAIRKLATDCDIQGFLGLLWCNEEALLKFARRIEARAVQEALASRTNNIGRINGAQKT